MRGAIKCLEYCRGVVVVIESEGEDIVVVVIIVDRVMVGVLKSPILAICWDCRRRMRFFDFIEYSKLYQSLRRFSRPNLNVRYSVNCFTSRLTYPITKFV